MELVKLQIIKVDDPGLQMGLSKWKTELDDIIDNPFIEGHLLTGIQLSSGTNVVNHKLGRKMQGWTIVDQNASSEIFRTQDFNDLTLTLSSSAGVTISLWVF